MDAAFNGHHWSLLSPADGERLRTHATDPRYGWLKKESPYEAGCGIGRELQIRCSSESLDLVTDNRGPVTLGLKRYRPLGEVLVLRELEGCSYDEIATIQASSVRRGPIIAVPGPASVAFRSRSLFDRSLLSRES